MSVEIPAGHFFLFCRMGDLAFWYNIELNQNVDYLTFHGGCPVLVGSKWITNKWIREISTNVNLTLL